MIRAPIALACSCVFAGRLLAAAAPSTDAASAGFDFCAAPVRPACVDDAHTYADPIARKFCDDDVDRYLASVFVYRGCMYAQIERAIRRANESAALLKCREAKKAVCP